jgi:hypothetical protein
MKEMIGYCGYNCHLCAARSDWGMRIIPLKTSAVMDVRVMVE